MAFHAAAVFAGSTLVKVAASQLAKHAYDKAVKHQRNKKHYQQTQRQQQQSSSSGSGPSNYIYRDAYCDGCGKFINDGIRYYCLQCPNFDLCENCHMSPYITTSKGVHYQNHRMIKMDQQDEESVASSRSSSPSLYSFAQCDVCGVYPIVDTRYKCLQCPDFDLCERCYHLPSSYRSIKGHTAHHSMLAMIE
jgi:hypothetical protein